MEEPILSAQSSTSSATSPSLRCAWGVALGLTAGWTAAGSCGVLVASLQNLLVWLLLIAAAILVRPQLGLRNLAVAAAVVSLFLLVPRAIGGSPIHLPLAVVAALGLIGLGEHGINRRLLIVGAVATLGLALFRFAQMQIPLVWLWGDALGGSLGHLISWATGRPLEIGATFAGLDFLVTMTVFWSGLFLVMRAPRLASALFAVVSFLLAQMAYLLLLAFTPQFTDALPPAAVPLFDNPYIPPEFGWSTIAQSMLPWNLPAAGALLQAMATVLIIRWTPWSTLEEPAPVTESVEPARRRISWGMTAALAALAILLPLVGALHFGSSTLTGKKISANAQDDIDYVVAEHDAYGQQSAGMFGLLPSFVQSLGGDFQTVSALTAEDLRDTDILLLFYPDEAFVAQRQQIWEYVRGGGAAVIVTDGFNPEFGLDSVTGELLSETAIAISSDAATSETTNWQDAYLAAASGAMSTANSPSVRFLSDYGASLQLGWGARPMVVGRWGWSAPQQAATWEESQPMRTGERLGDLVLVAEQRMGRGRVVVLGGGAPLMNEGIVHGYPLVGSLLADLAHDRSGAQAPWRQAVGAICSFAIVILLLRRPDVTQLVWVGTILGLGFAACHAWNRHEARVIPRGELISTPVEGDSHRRIAYIDQSHLEAYSFEDWGFDAINGLALNLMRNGYIPLMLPEVTAERLEGADLLISIAPSREFTVAERATVKSFVDRGGILVCTVGAEQAAPSASLLAEFELAVPASPIPTDAVPTDDGRYESEPFGRTRALYLNVAIDEQDSYDVAMRLHAAWPVESTDGRAEVYAYGQNQLRVVESDTQLPVVLARQYGRGRVILIGDTGFAMNKNLEYIGGEPFDGGYENAHFWRWLIARVTGRPKWTPPRRVESAATAATEEDP